MENTFKSYELGVSRAFSDEWEYSLYLLKGPIFGHFKEGILKEVNA